MKTQKKVGAKKGQPAIPQNDTLAQFFQRRPFLERVGPVLAELGRMLCPDENEDGPELPDYCHRILQIFRRTYFKHFPALTDIARIGGSGQPVEVDWRLLGKMMGIALRCLRFGQYELEKSSGQTPAQEQAFLRSFLGEEPLEPDETYWNDCTEKINSAFLNWNQAAFAWGPGAMTELSLGVAEGLKGFINETGQFAGESNRANTYWFLLLAWPEISQMQQARPPKTRNDFAAWIQPFAGAGVVSLNDLDQICDVCDDLGLKFTGRGRRSNQIPGQLPNDPVFDPGERC